MHPALPDEPITGPAVDYSGSNYIQNAYHIAYGQTTLLSER